MGTPTKQDLQELTYLFSICPTIGVILFFSELIFIEESDLVYKFSRFGKIVSARIMTDQEGKSKGYGFVSYETPENA